MTLPFFHSWDAALFTFAAEHSWAAMVVIFFAQYVPYIVIVSVIGIALLRPLSWQQRALRGIVDVAPAVFALLVALVIKALVVAPRPFVVLPELSPLVHVNDPLGSFPSAHAAFFIALGVSLWKKYPSRGLWYLFFGLCIASARVFAGVHWSIDVLYGALLGIMSASLFVVLYRVMIK